MGGWKGSGRCLRAPYSYTFEAKTESFLKKIDRNSGLACRDFYSVKALKNAGLKSALMTGCPAWYDIENIHCTELKDNSWSLKNIYISDPAQAKNYKLLFGLIETLHEMYNEANITLVFHRSTESENERQLLIQLNTRYEYLKITRLNGEAEAFNCYKNCDLHIGFRVHAHIFNLSLRKKTILIEEDGRGAGVNEALGLPGLLTYNDEFQPISSNKLSDKIKKKILTVLSANGKGDFVLRKQVENYIEMMQSSNGIYYENAFRLMEEYYKTMEQYIWDSTR